VKIERNPKAVSVGISDLIPGEVYMDNDGDYFLALGRGFCRGPTPVAAVSLADGEVYWNSSSDVQFFHVNAALKVF